MFLLVWLHRSELENKAKRLSSPIWKFPAFAWFFFFCSGVWRQITQLIEVCSHVGAQKNLKSKMSQELRMPSSVTLYCEVTMTVMLWGSQNGRWEQKWLFFLLPLSSNFSKIWVSTSDHVWLLSSCKEPLTFVLKQGLIFQSWQNTVKHHRRCAASQNAQNILRKIGGDSMQFVWRNNTDAVQACWWQKLKKKNVGGTNWNYSGVVESVAWQQSDTMSVTLPWVQLLRLKDRAKIQEQYNCIK